MYVYDNTNVALEDDGSYHFCIGTAFLGFELGSLLVRFGRR